MDYDFAEFDNIPSLCNKREKLNQAIQNESETVRLMFYKSKQEAKAILKEIESAWEELRERSKESGAHENLHWYQYPAIHFSFGILIFITGYFFFSGVITLGEILIFVGLIGHFNRQIDRNYLGQRSDNIWGRVKDYEIRFESICTGGSIYFVLLNREQKRISSLNPSPERSDFLDVWSHRANLWLNLQYGILGILTERHNVHEMDWTNNLDATFDAYLEKIKKYE